MLAQIVLFIVLGSFLVIGFARLITGLYAATRTYSVAEAPIRRVAIVFGAGLRRDGSPSPILQDRVATAAELYFAGKVEKLLLSGDNRFVNYNEPEAMRRYAISLGVPNEDLVLDYAGRRTYDTCYRAAAIFGVKQAILVTQAFHLPRAIYLCNHLGVDGVGVEADRRVYRRSSMTYWTIRELLATVNALWEVHVTRPLPVLGKPEPIFSEEP
ncbi:MAG: YdcF family protein [Anaerolineales bacterium]|nr:YdcF family protein [Anaerolineales bacterium]MCX7607606.1 YdcF family protein [Anaerolineales bacterium]MDW8226845.1 ElyC/SanA/YdcF family protein [Anaerolineales bacterium]